MSQENKVAFVEEVDVSWVGCVGDRVGKSYMEKIGEIFLVEGVLVRRVVGALDVSR